MLAHIFPADFPCRSSPSHHPDTEPGTQSEPMPGQRRGPAMLNDPHLSKFRLHGRKFDDKCGLSWSFGFCIAHQSDAPLKSASTLLIMPRYVITPSEKSHACPTLVRPSLSLPTQVYLRTYFYPVPLSRRTSSATDIVCSCVCIRLL